MKKIAVIFPGIGYHTDKPLLYYSRMLARESGYEIVQVPYKNFPPRIRGVEKKMRQAFETGLDQAEKLLSDIRFDEYEKVLFISKSIGTTIAYAYAIKWGIEADHLWYTPMAETFRAPEYVSKSMRKTTSPTIMAFHGTADPWADTQILTSLCQKFNIPLFLTEGGNHSLETGDAMKDLETLKNVMEKSRRLMLY